MKQLRTLLTLLVVSFCAVQNAWADVEINETNFPDANFRSYLLSESYGSDGVITNAEIAGIDYMWLSEKNIASLKGIEYFTALTSLYCDKNQLTTLDISKNTALIILSCDNNQLTTLDVTKNTALGYLTCASNQLTALDVSKNTSLVHLYCGSNQLTSLDVSKNTTLEALYCDDNKLTTLNVSGLSALKWLSCFGNQLSSLNVEGCTSLGITKAGDPEPSLNCFANQLKGAAIDALIAALPVRTCNLNIIVKHELEGNVMTAAQVAAARAKGWRPLAYDIENNLWLPYQGAGVPEPEAVEINETNFPDEVFRNYVSQNFDLIQDGKLSYLEIAQIKKINVNKKNVQSVKGVEFFTELEQLRCKNNQLTAIDISRNTLLTLLDATNNQLTTIDLSKNLAMEDLYVAENQLTALDISKQSDLKQLEASENKITALDLSNKPRLESLYCDENQITTLDLSGAPALENLRCYKNLLTSLNVSKNTALRTLRCYSNQLTSLDVSNNTALSNLSCDDNQLTSLDVTKNTVLGLLSCCQNQLTALDVSKNTSLTSLSCYNNQLTSLNVSGCTELTILQCYRNQIKGEAMDVLVAGLSTQEYASLYVVYNENESNVMTTTQVAAAKAKGWTILYYDGTEWKEYTGSEPLNIEINETNFPDANFRTYLLSQSFGSDGVITDTEIAGITKIKVNEMSIQSLKGIEFFTALTRLECTNNQLTSLDLSKNTALTVLDCLDNQLTAFNISGCTELIKLRCNNNQLTTLDLSKNTKLEELYCIENQLTTLDVSECTVLRRLDCSGNQLTALDVTKNSALQSLNCDNNKLTTLTVSGCTALQNLTTKNNLLTVLDASGCTALMELHCDNNKLTSLNVSGCTGLGLLACYSNQIKNTAMDAFVESLPNVTWGFIQVIYNENEGNVMTTTQVEAAKAKGWIPYYYDGTEWKEYEGSEPTGIEAVESISSNETIDDAQATWYDLNGRRVTTPTKGIYVKNGKKIVIK